MICLALGFVLALVVRLYLTWINRVRDRSIAVTAADGAYQGTDQAGVMVNLMDKTDKEIPQFRYVY